MGNKDHMKPWTWIAMRIWEEHHKHAKALPDEWHIIAGAKIYAELKQRLGDEDTNGHCDMCGRSLNHGELICNKCYPGADEIKATL